MGLLWIYSGRLQSQQKAKGLGQSQRMCLQAEKNQGDWEFPEDIGTLEGICPHSFQKQRASTFIFDASRPMSNYISVLKITQSVAMSYANLHYCTTLS